MLDRPIYLYMPAVGLNRGLKIHAINWRFPRLGWQGELHHRLRERLSLTLSGCSLGFPGPSALIFVPALYRA